MVIEPCPETSQLKHFTVTDAVIGAFYDVYNELGHGFLESVYREAMMVALRSKNVPVEREKTRKCRVFVAKLLDCFAPT